MPKHESKESKHLGQHKGCNYCKEHSKKKKVEMASKMKPPSKGLKFGKMGEDMYGYRK